MRRFSGYYYHRNSSRGISTDKRRQRRSRNSLADLTRRDQPYETNVSFTGPGFTALPRRRSSRQSSSHLGGTKNRKDHDNTKYLRHSAGTNVLGGLFHAHPTTENVRPSNRVSRFLKHLVKKKKSMGQVCCAGREDEEAKILLENNGERTALALFDQAYVSNDIPAFIQLLDSNEPFSPKPSGGPMHPWAAPPQSVAALAATQLAALASGDDMATKEAVKPAIPIFIKMLHSGKQDQVDAALVALSFLSIENNSGCIKMYENGIFNALVPLFKSPKLGVQGAVAQTCRNVYVLDPQYRRAFRDANGTSALVDLLDIKPGSSNFDLQIESIYHLDDLIMHNGQELSDILNHLKSTTMIVGKLDVLQNMGESGDLQDAAQQLYLRMAE